MKTIQEVKEEVAKRMGFVDFDNAMKAYGEMLLREAAERAKATITKQQNNVIEAGEKLKKPKDELSVVYMRYMNSIEATEVEILSLIDEMK